ncbi:MAG TPA: ubiquinol-cytochrome C chaperone family protein [Sphingomonadaceae bacterium]|nr:ubiquinol-cytochrome C chaperone family protein [Sphingomonadaceae bacterium]
MAGNERNTVSLFRTLLRGPADRASLRPLYDAIVREARRPAWYIDGAVPDTFDGRFEMVATLLALVLIRLEGDGEAARAPSAWLTEIFIEDMDGQLRERGIGDIVVGKHVGRMMSALGGRLGAYREALAPDATPGLLETALVRNVYRGAAPPADAGDWLADAVRRLWQGIGAVPLDALLAGQARP